jgi:glyoxylase-like metal-dependent hydrolase (beta-lactamase superfamily II)
MDVEVIDLEFQGMPGGIAAFLVRGGEGWLLVETGPESTRHLLLAGLAERGVGAGDLAAVLVTHIHLDHAGAAGWFASQGVPVYVHTKGARHLVDPARLIESARGVYGERFDSLWGEMLPAPEDRVRSLDDGETISVAGLSVTALDTPGHAFHHHAFRIGDEIFVGDAAGARLGGSHYLSVTSAPPQFHLEHTLASIDRLAVLGAERLWLTHFGPVDDPVGHLSAYREAVELNAEFVRHRVLEGFSGEALAVAYEAFQLEQAYRLGMPPDHWPLYEAINAAAMCAEGMRQFWCRRFEAAS